MANKTDKQLIEWIKTEEAQGFSDQQIEKYLIGRGFKKKDVDGIIILLHPKDNIFFWIEQLFKPSLLKVIIPLVILLAVILANLTSIAFSFERERIDNEMSSLLLRLDNIDEQYVDYVSQINADASNAIEMMSIRNDAYNKYLDLSIKYNESEYPMLATTAFLNRMSIPDYMKNTLLNSILISLLILFVSYVIVCFISLVIKLIIIHNYVLGKTMPFIVMIAIVVILAFLALGFIDDLAGVSGKIKVTGVYKLDLDFETIECTKTKLLDDDEKSRLVYNQKYIDEPWNVCYEPYCFFACQDAYKAKLVSHMNLRGDNPKCVCVSRK